MSDFDKEAEREKLREKYERDQEEREVAEKMSELLLQGATMTNAHCSECGDPIFRYEGQEFCATCEKAVQRDTGVDEDEDADEADDGNIEVTTPDENARVQFGAGTDDAADAANQPAEQPTQQPAESSPQEDTQTQPRQPGQSPAQSQGQPQQPQQSTSGEQAQPPRQSAQHEQAREVPSVDPDAGADASTARESLVRTLTRFSQQAEATDDPRRAQEYLAAAREAAEALSALRR